jgi:hypothetical protein
MNWIAHFEEFIQPAHSADVGVIHGAISSVLG